MTPGQPASAASRVNATVAEGGNTASDWAALGARIVTWGKEIGFGAVGVSDVDLADAETRLLNWLAAGRHGDMDYMARHGKTRARPADLVPGTIRVITARLDYWPAAAKPAREVLAQRLGGEHRRPGDGGRGGLRAGGAGIDQEGERHERAACHERPDPSDHPWRACHARRCASVAPGATRPAAGG